MLSRSRIIAGIGFIIIIAFFCSFMVAGSAAVPVFAAAPRADVEPRARLEPTSGLEPRAGLEPAPTGAMKPTSTPAAKITPKITPAPTPTPAPRRFEILGFDMYSFKSGQAAYSLMEKNKDLLTSIASSTYSIGTSGEMIGKIADWQVSFANKNSISPLLLITNSFDREVSKSILEDPKIRSIAIDNLLGVLKKGSYKGVNIDFESVYAADRDKYTEFIKEVYLKLKPLGYTVTISLPAKYVDDPKKTWSYAYDYKSIGKYVDRALIMTYDEHYKKGSPGPIASIDWVKSVMTYAASTIPKSKLYVGLSAYGYDWGPSGGVSASVDGCYDLAKANSAKVEFDPIAKCPHFDYTDANKVKHQVWFENAESISYKLSIVSSMGLKGVGIWRMGTMNRDYWDTLRNWR